MNILTCTILSALALGCHAQLEAQAGAKINHAKRVALYHALYLEYLVEFSQKTPSLQTPILTSHPSCLPTSIEIPLHFSFSSVLSLSDRGHLRNQVGIANAAFAPLAVSFSLASVNRHTDREKKRDGEASILFDTLSDASAEAIIQKLADWLDLDNVKAPWTKHQHAHVFATFFSFRNTPPQDGTHCDSDPILSDKRIARRLPLARRSSSRRGKNTLQMLEKLASSPPDPSSRIFVDGVTGEVLVCNQQGGCEPPSFEINQPQPAGGTGSGDLRRAVTPLEEGDYSG
ncbi:hypothetical protein QBC39DRAFT_341075 [Podospora conica]|nr:hypothetical protein QBC39DRAFT_341075 [Schizothecium conicum]